MGGCRCTYRNCTVKSDGITHMFHYPVFDKVRCHQWLTNAHRLELLNLKLSQLKNRVVCQHHFKDECFMNFLKKKLTFEAVPTEDGPFCDSNQFTQNNSIPEVAKVTRDYIEQEYLSTTEKKANFSVKYGDFLTNCEVMDIVSLDMKNETKESKDISLKENNSNVNLDIDGNYFKYLLEPHKIISAKKSEQSSIITQCSKPTNVGDELTLLSNRNQKQIKNKMKHKLVTPKSKTIKIISEQKLSQPVIFTGKLTPISPSIIIEPPGMKENVSIGNNKADNSQSFVPSSVCKEKENTVVQENSIKTHNIAPILTDLVVSGINNVKSQEIRKPVKKPNQLLVQKNQALSPQKPQIQSKVVKGSGPPYVKSKITPERVAAIEEKRKFNMKLRDIIETCLKNWDENDKAVNDEKISRHIRKKDKCGVLCQDSNNTKISENTITSLEARLKRMEETLLNKINQNSDRITDLKDSLTPTPNNAITFNKRKSHGMKSVEAEEVYKKQLYQEISQYLSPETNSLIYEELFLNKFVQKLPICGPSSKKRRKRSFVNIIL